MSLLGGTLNTLHMLRISDRSLHFYYRYVHVHVYFKSLNLQLKLAESCCSSHDWQFQTEANRSC